MSHEFQQGFFSNKQPAWHKLGTVLDGCPDYDTAIKLSGADRLVEKRELYYETSSGIYAPVDSHVVNIRGDIQMGVVGRRYEIVQDTEAFAFVKPLLDDGTLTLDAGVSLRDGRTFCLTAKMANGQADVLPGDEQRLYLVLSNSHDGTSPVSIGFTSIRVVCMNTNRMFLQGTQAGDNHSLRMKHTRSVHLGIETARETIDVIQQTWHADLDVFRRMAIKTMSGLEFSRFARKLITPTNQEEPITDLHGKTRKALETLEANFVAFDGPTEATGTAWAAYNAVTSYVDHDRYADERKAFEFSWNGAGQDMRESALALLTVVVAS